MRFTLEYRKTPARATPVPEWKSCEEIIWKEESVIQWNKHASKLRNELLWHQNMNFTKWVDRRDGCLEEEDGAHNDNHTLHAITNWVCNRGYPLQYHIGNLQCIIPKRSDLAILKKKSYLQSTTSFIMAHITWTNNDLLQPVFYRETELQPYTCTCTHFLF
jgi:hypothetical protein